ncbi:MAG TPA: hypothetical protein VGP93_13655 [Polyangiaceae bacterium]|nr:hypothetical protein [Polyangiaceae bacterium]
MLPDPAAPAVDVVPALPPALAFPVPPLELPLEPPAELALPALPDDPPFAGSDAPVSPVHWSKLSPRSPAATTSHEACPAL